MTADDQNGGRVLWTTLSMMLFMLVYLALMAACLLQWGTDDPWARINLFTGTAIAISLLMGVEQLEFNRALPPAPEVKREAFGMNYDPGMAKWVALLALLELLVFMDYGHWHLAPALERPALQAAGLALYLLALIWLRRVDQLLARHFKEAGGVRAPLTSGPFQFVRHPRYLGLVVSRVAFALCFASVIGWLLVLCWVMVIRRRILLEEAHLRQLFGTGYESYARHRARLLPGIY